MKVGANEAEDKFGSVKQQNKSLGNGKGGGTYLDGIGFLIIIFQVVLNNVVGVEVAICQVFVIRWLIVILSIRNNNNEYIGAFKQRMKMTMILDMTHFSEKG